MLTVRKAIPEDAVSIIEFQLNMAWETEKTALDRETVTKGVNAVFSDPNKGEYYVTQDEDRVVASLLITYEWSDWRNCNVWWFQSVYVVPEYRRQGIFRKMYHFIKEKTEELGVAGLRLYVETGNVQAMKTYEALGMTGEHYNFYEWMRK
ncbi:MAG: family N-acetyltransferase [Bacteroidetes bacterium]|jgi:GNAT superfamily N-acetyltransferase|nr:family N-acetyltransferase [Bacteroidota bacterium]